MNCLGRIEALKKRSDEIALEYVKAAQKKSLMRRRPPGHEFEGWVIVIKTMLQSHPRMLCAVDLRKGQKGDIFTAAMETRKPQVLQLVLSSVVTYDRGQELLYTGMLCNILILY